MSFTGSSKSMEPDMVVEMVGRTLKKGVRMEGLVGDDDTTAITRINEELDPNIQKHSDKNHVKRTLQIPCTIFKKHIKASLLKL